VDYEGDTTEIYAVEREPAGLKTFEVYAKFPDGRDISYTVLADIPESIRRNETSFFIFLPSIFSISKSTTKSSNCSQRIIDLATLRLFRLLKIFQQPIADNEILTLLVLFTLRCYSN
jgi:hypothetical protein